MLPGSLVTLTEHTYFYKYDRVITRGLLLGPNDLISVIAMAKCTIGKGNDFSWWLDPQHQKIENEIALLFVLFKNTLYVRVCTFDIPKLVNVPAERSRYVVVAEASWEHLNK